MKNKGKRIKELDEEVSELNRIIRKIDRTIEKPQRVYDGVNLCEKCRFASTLCTEPMISQTQGLVLNTMRTRGRSTIITECKGHKSV